MRMRILFLSSLLTTFLYIPTIAQLVDKSCSDPSNYTSNSAFLTNLNLLLSSLSSNSFSGFFNSSSGQDPDAVYGLLLCRGDATPDTCRNCISLARQGIIQQCPNKKDAIVWYQSCFLRYSQTRFFSVLDNSTKVFKSNALNVLEPNRFHQVLRGMLGNISYEAAYNSSMVPRLFATGEAIFTSTQMIYGLVQCTRDLSASDCYKCLTTEISEIPMCCSGKQGGQLLGASCNLRYEIYPFFYEEQVAALGPAPPFPSPASSATSDSLAPVADNINASSTIGNQGSERISSQVIVAIVVPVVIGVALFMFIINICLVRRKNKGKTIVRHRIGNVESLQFDLATIRTATANFLDANKLGQGGFGSVYKGKLSDGQEIAVKRLFRSSKQGLEEFKNEVELVAKLQHRNLVRLLGCCLEGEEQILIFEYVPNKSLDQFLFDSTKRACLDWERRYKIIEGIARGLLYLHEDSRLKIIHRDLKASNVLLDGEMNPKISDFGTARLFDVGQTQGDTSRITGTYGYMSPEYAMQGKFSIKSDVFSFGVLLLEIMTGLKNYGFHQSDLAEDLPSYAWRHWNDGTASKLIDATLIEGCCMEEVMRCIHIGLLCVQEKVADRPTMSSVVLMLNKDSVTLPSPLPPVFSAGNRSESDIPTTIECDSCTAEFDLSDCKLLSWPVTEVLDIELGTR